MAALPSGAMSLSSGSPVQGLAAVATVSLSLLVLSCSISRACVVSTFSFYFFRDVTLRLLEKKLLGSEQEPLVVNEHAFVFCFSRSYLLGHVQVFVCNCLFCVILIVLCKC